MTNDQLSQIIEQSLVAPKLGEKKPWQKGKSWVGQLCAIVNLVPEVGGALACEIQNVADAASEYKTSEFLRKFTAFILGLEEMSEEERHQFADEIQETAHDASGNVIMGIVDSLDNINKQQILANLVIARGHGFITIDDFFRLSSMLARIPYVDLKYLPKYKDPYYDPSGDTELLYSTGVLCLDVIDAENGNRYRLSSLGKKLLAAGFRVQVNSDSETKGTQILAKTVSHEDINKMFEEKKAEIIAEAKPKWEVVDETLIMK